VTQEHQESRVNKYVVLCLAYRNRYSPHPHSFFSAVNMVLNGSLVLFAVSVGVWHSFCNLSAHLRHDHLVFRFNAQILFTIEGTGEYITAFNERTMIFHTLVLTVHGDLGRNSAHLAS